MTLSHSSTRTQEYVPKDAKYTNEFVIEIFNEKFSSRSKRVAIKYVGRIVVALSVRRMSGNFILPKKQMFIHDQSSTSMDAGCKKEEADCIRKVEWDSGETAL